MRRLIRRFLIWAGYVPTWFSEDEFRARVGRFPCVDCRDVNDGFLVVFLCDYDTDAWFDAVVA